MYYIDLSFLKGSCLDPEISGRREEDYNNILKDFVAESIQLRYRNTSSCMLCGIDLTAGTPIDDRNIVEVHCAGLLGCNFCEVKMDSNIPLKIGDMVIIENEESHEVATVCETGEIVKLKRRQFGLYGETLPHVIRTLDANDIKTLERNSSDEKNAVRKFRESAGKHNLDMKLVSIHYQFDRKKLFFFYTSEGRVDFREMAKDLAAEFKTRIELRQIGVRDEAKRVGGLGTCGREYCCSSFLNNFKRITTQLANDQNLLSNMSKLSGPCGKLKCCLSFEIE